MSVLCIVCVCVCVLCVGIVRGYCALFIVVIVVAIFFLTTEAFSVNVYADATADFWGGRKGREKDDK